MRCLSNVSRNLAIALNNCEIWMKIGMKVSSGNGARKFSITDTKLYVSVIFLSTQGNIKLLKELESGFKRIINWNKYQSKFTEQTWNIYLVYFIESYFHTVNWIFILSFDREVHIRYFFPKVKMKDYKILIDGTNFFYQPIQIDLRINGCLRDYPCFKKY